MQAKLLGYLLNALEDEEARGVEEMLAASEEARRQLEILRYGLMPLGGNATTPEPPRGLSVRTCEMLREIRRTDPS